MRVHDHMMLSDLAERMGQSATDPQARRMRDILIREGYAGADTADVPDAEWRGMLAEVTTASPGAMSGFTSDLHHTPRPAGNPGRSITNEQST